MILDYSKNTITVAFTVSLYNLPKNPSQEDIQMALFEIIAIASIFACEDENGNREPDEFWFWLETILVPSLYGNSTAGIFTIPDDKTLKLMRECDFKNLDKLLTDMRDNNLTNPTQKEVEAYRRLLP